MLATRVCSREQGHTAGLAGQAKKGPNGKVGDEEAEGEPWMARRRGTVSAQVPLTCQGHERQPLSPPHPASTTRGR